MSDMYCVFVLAPQHANGAVFACRGSAMRGRASAECEWSCKLAHNHISHISLPQCIAALLLTYESTVLRDAETLSLREGFLVCSRTDQTTLQYEASSLYERTFADGYC